MDGKLYNDLEQNSSRQLLANWRWVHNGKGKNCYEGSKWDSTLCPDSKTCLQNCVLDGVSQEQYSKTYGVNVKPSSLTLNYKTGTNIGSRLYVLDPSKKNYYGFDLMNKEFTFTVDVSQLGCGINGALYLVNMDLENPNPEEAGPAYGNNYQVQLIFQ